MASKIPFWQTDPLAWDQLIINGKTVPGLTKVSIKKGRRLDIRKGPKQHGSALVDQGKPAIEGEFEILIGFDSAPDMPYGTAEQQWDAWCALEEELFGGKPKKRRAYDVKHPKLQWAKVSKVFLEDPNGLDEDGPGAKTIKINWVQYGKISAAESGTVEAGPIKPKGNTDIRTLANAKKPSQSNAKP